MVHRAWKSSVTRAFDAVLGLMPREGGGLPTAEQKREEAKRPTAEQKREDAKRRGLALSFVSLLVLDVGLLDIVLKLFMTVTERGSGEMEQASGSMVLLFMAMYTVGAFFVMHHIEFTKARNHVVKHPQMCAILPCFADPCAEQKYVNGAGPAEVYGIPLMHALGCVCLIIAKYFELGGDCPTPMESTVWSIVGALLLFGSGLIEEFF